MRETPRSIDQPGPTLSAAELEFAQRAGSALRTAEPLPAEFEERVMLAVTSDGDRGPLARRVTSRSWWMRPHRVTLSPLGGLALAAGFAAVIATGAYGVAGRLGFPAGASAVAPADTVHLVRFVLVDPTASRVALAGDFNGWSAEARPLSASGVAGVWTVTVPLAPGRYEYAFVVDGTRWIADPLSRRVADEFGGESSVIRVDGSATRTM